MKCPIMRHSFSEVVVFVFASGSDPDGMPHTTTFNLALHCLQCIYKFDMYFFVDPYYVDYWITSTDYISYSVIYGCRQQNADGQCTLQDTWVYSRTPQLPGNKAAIVESTLDALCVNKSALLVTQQNNGKYQRLKLILLKWLQNYDNSLFFVLSEG